MLLGGKGGCQQCSCVPCDACTRTCTNPHTGTAFSTVYTRYAAGSEAGNPSDGYLSATGDNDTSDPSDGMDGTGPWYQEVSGSFTLSSSTTRYPCAVRVSFWRNTYTLGPIGVGSAPSSALTLNRIRVSVSSSSETGVFSGNQYIAPGGSYDFSDGISVVSGSGDRSASDPRSFSGTMSVTPECANKTAMFTISARVEWNTKKRQHIVYGIVRECYEEGSPCGTACSGSAAPNTIYVKVSNFSGDVGKRTDGTSLDYNGTYALDRDVGLCNTYYGQWEFGCSKSNNPLGESLGTMRLAAWVDGTGAHVSMYRTALFSGVCRAQQLLIEPTFANPFCGSGVLGSGTNGKIYIDVTGFPTFDGTLASGSFDWEISA